MGGKRDKQYSHSILSFQNVWQTRRKKKKLQYTQAATCVANKLKIFWNSTVHAKQVDFEGFPEWRFWLWSRDVIRNFVPDHRTSRLSEKDVWPKHLILLQGRQRMRLSLDRRSEEHEWTVCADGGLESLAVGHVTATGWVSIRFQKSFVPRV